MIGKRLFHRVQTMTNKYIKNIMTKKRGTAHKTCLENIENCNQKTLNKLTHSRTSLSRNQKDPEKPLTKKVRENCVNIYELRR